jgi:hypothetical protein
MKWCVYLLTFRTSEHLLTSCIQADDTLQQQGHSHMTEHCRHVQPHYGYGYDGLDWPEEYATCSGARQSPINVPGHTSKFPPSQACSSHSSANPNPGCD